MPTFCGILIEPRDHFAINFVIYNFFEVFQNTTLYFFCGKTFYTSNKKLELLKKYKNLKIINYLKSDNLSFMEYNDVCKSLDFWDYFIEDYSLVIQTDGCICKNSHYKIEDFFKYDYVGGYSYYRWREIDGIFDNEIYHCFNGGFSLRNIKAVKECLIVYKPMKSKDYEPGQNFREYGEDVFFVIGMKKLGYNVGIDQYATNFCSHTNYISNTFCVHKLYYFVDKSIILKFLEYCDDFINIIPFTFI